MDSPSDAEVIGRSLGEPEAFGLIYDRHAATLLRFLGRRAGAKVAEGSSASCSGSRSSGARRSKRRGERTPVAVRDRLEPVAEAPAGEARRLRASARIAGLEATDGRSSARALDARVLFSRVADAIEALPGGEREALLLFAWEEPRTRAWPRHSSCRSARCARGSTALACACAN